MRSLPARESRQKYSFLWRLSMAAVFGGFAGLAFWLISMLNRREDRDLFWYPLAILVAVGGGCAYLAFFLLFRYGRGPMRTAGTWVAAILTSVACGFTAVQLGFHAFTVWVIVGFMCLVLTIAAIPSSQPRGARRRPTERVGSKGRRSREPGSMRDSGRQERE